MGHVFAGRYELVDPLGEGGAGVVWRAWDRRNRGYCAAKVLRQVDASSLLRFMREQSLRLDHPHILTPTGWAGEDEKVLFTMPIAAGGSVATVIADFGPLPARLTAVLLDQLLAALDATHAEGVVHRDVKPANLLLDATGLGYPHLRLADFGIAAGEDVPRLTQGPFTVGTPGYAAPEARQAGWDPEPRADLYAAGICAVEMLTGLKPDDDVDVPRALTQAQRTEPVPAELAEVVATLAHPAPLQRYDSAAQARTALRATGLLSAPTSEEVLGEVEIFNHTPALPQGWTEHGPAESMPAPPRQASAEPLRQSPAAAAPAEQHRPTAADNPRPRSRASTAIALVMIGAGLVLLAIAGYLLLG